MSDGSSAQKIAGIAAAAGLILFLGSRIAVETNRVSEAGDDRGFFLANTVVTVVITAGAFAVFLFILVRSGHALRTTMLEMGPGSLVIILDGHHQTAKSIAAFTGTHRRYSMAYFGLVADPSGLEIWRGAGRPRLIVTIAAADLVKLEPTTVYMFPAPVKCVALTVKSGEQIHQLLLAPTLLRRYFFMAMTEPESIDLIAELNSLWKLGGQGASESRIGEV